jgi:hypothetical protein
MAQRKDRNWYGKGKTTGAPQSMPERHARERGEASQRHAQARSDMHEQHQSELSDLTDRQAAEAQQQDQQRQQKKRDDETPEANLTNTPGPVEVGTGARGGICYGPNCGPAGES